MARQRIHPRHADSRSNISSREMVGEERVCLMTGQSLSSLSLQSLQGAELLCHTSIALRLLAAKRRRYGRQG